MWTNDTESSLFVCFWWKKGMGGEKVAEGEEAGQRPAGEGREGGTGNYLNRCVFQASKREQTISADAYCQ